MNHWQALVRTALIGTERQQPDWPSTNTEIGSLLVQIDTADRERAVLHAAAVLAPVRKASKQADQVSSPLPEPAPPDRLQRCPAEAAEYVVLLVVQRLYTELLPEFLQALATRRYRIPEEYVPDLLTLGASRPELQPLILLVIGERGQWVAAQNPEWSYAVSETAVDVWQTGSRTQRRAFLKHVRSVDPGRGRKLLESTWPHEEAKDRATFITLLEAGLTLDDEPFLEAALDDRRKEVRSAAADLLARLPTSGLVRRMLERVRPLLSFTPQKKRQLLGLQRGEPARLTVTLPEACDKAMQRDGIEPKTSRTEFGDKAWWLVQMLAAIPPSTWSTIWETTPQTLIATTSQSEWQLALLEAWAWAAQRHGDVEWAEALLTARPESFDRKQQQQVWHGQLLNVFLQRQLLDVLPPNRRETLVMAVMQAKQADLRDPLWTLLPYCEHPWSDVFSRAVLAQLRHQAATSKDNQNNIICGYLSFYARLFAPSVLPEATLSWPENPNRSPYWNTALGDMLTLLEFRHTMHTAINGG